VAKIIRTPKPLSVNPLKASQPVGASLAFLGLNRALPLMHGSQGCTAFAKVFLVRHFREPIPLQTTAMDQIATVMGADENVIQALAGDPDLVCSFARFLDGMGAEIPVAVAPVKAHALEALPIDSVIIGDLEDLERRRGQ